MSPIQTVGFLGAGQMGEPMVIRLVRAGHRVVVFARRDDVRKRLSDAGASLADSIAELAAQSDILIACMFSDRQLREVGLGSAGFIANIKPGSVVLSHTTGTATTLDDLAAASRTPPTILDAPVSGTVEDITTGNLTVLIGGPSAAVEQAVPVLSAYANPIIPTGSLGTALNLKLVNNALFAANAQLLAAAAGVATQLGIDTTRLLDVLRSCSGGSAAGFHAHAIGGIDQFAELAAPFLRKDVAAAIEAAAAAGANLGLLASVIERGPLPLTAASTPAP